MKRFIAAILSTTLFVEQVHPYPSSTPANFGIKLTNRLGSITETFNPSNQAKPEYILIQNLHSNRSVQRAISGTLESLKSQKLLSNRIAVEGLTGLYDAREMQRVEPAFRKRAANYLVAQGEMPGALHFVVSQGKGELFGVEDPALYDAALMMFQRSYASRVQLREELSLLREALTEVKRDPELRMNATSLEKDIVSLQNLVEGNVIPSDVRQTLVSAGVAIERLKAALPREIARKVWEPLSASADYYALALLRDESLYDGARSLHEKGHQPTTVLITGGFHTPGITQRLRAEGKSFAVITPTVQKHTAVDERLYTERMLERHLSEDQVAEGKDWAAMGLTEPRLASNLSSLFLARVQAVRRTGLLALLAVVLTGSPLQGQTATPAPISVASFAVELPAFPQDTSRPAPLPAPYNKLVADLRSLDDSVRNAAISALTGQRDPLVVQTIIYNAISERENSQFYGHHVLAALRVVTPLADTSAQTLARATLRNVSEGLSYPKDDRSPPDIDLGRAAARVLEEIAKAHPAAISDETIGYLLKLVQAEDKRAVQIQGQVYNPSGERVLKILGARRVLQYFDHRMGKQWSLRTGNADTDYRIEHTVLDGLDIVKRLSYWQWAFWRTSRQAPIWIWTGFFLMVTGIVALLVRSLNPLSKFRQEASLSTSQPLSENLEFLMKKYGYDQFYRMLEGIERNPDKIEEGFNPAGPLLERLLDPSYRPQGQRIKKPSEADKKEFERRSDILVELIWEIGKHSGIVFKTLALMSEKINSVEELRDYAFVLERIFQSGTRLDPSAKIIDLAVYSIHDRIQSPESLLDKAFLLEGVEASLALLPAIKKKWVSRPARVEEYGTSSGSAGTEVPGFEGFVDEEDVYRSDRQNAKASIAVLKDPRFEFVERKPAQHRKAYSIEKKGSGKNETSTPTSPRNRRGGTQANVLMAVTAVGAIALVLFAGVPAATLAIGVMGVASLTAMITLIARLIQLIFAKRAEAQAKQSAVSMRVLLLTDALGRYFGAIPKITAKTFSATTAWIPDARVRASVAAERARIFATQA